MMSIELTGNERLQFQYILPIQGSIKTLELVERILEKSKINDIDMNNSIKIEFKKDEIEFIQRMISFLDEQEKLSYSSLSLIRKIMNIKGENKNV